MNHSDTARFRSKVKALSGGDGCWEWCGTYGAHGYGVFWMQGKPRRAHRVAYLLANGEWPEPCCLHACDNPRCVNPAHLSAGTYADNNADMRLKGRGAKGPRPNARRVRGEAHHSAKLDGARVHDMRERHANGETIATLARECGVTWRTMNQAVKGITWASSQEMAA